MSTIFWAVVFYLVGRRWWRKHPEAREAIKTFLTTATAGKTTTRATTRHEKREPKKHAAPPVTPHAGARKPQPILNQRKKAEKQFQEL